MVSTRAVAAAAAVKGCLLELLLLLLKRVGSCRGDYAGGKALGGALVLRGCDLRRRLGLLGDSPESCGVGDEMARGRLVVELDVSDALDAAHELADA